MELKEKDSLKDMLFKAKAENKRVDIVLSNGKMYTGTIKELGIQCVVLEQVGNRSFFDVIIKIEDISAFEFQARG